MHILDAPKKKNLISLTSLIDVVFILLVFFMLSTNFSKWNALILGTSQGTAIVDTVVEPSLIHVGFNQQYTLNDKVMPLVDIVKTLETKLQQTSDHPVLIQPVDKLPMQQLIDVIDAIAVVAANNISLVKVSE